MLVSGSWLVQNSISSNLLYRNSAVFSDLHSFSIIKLTVFIQPFNVLECDTRSV